MTARRLRLLFVIKSLGQAGGGAERVLSDVSSALAQRGHRVEIVSFDPGGRSDFYPLDPKVVRRRLGIGDTSRRSGTIEMVRKVRALRSVLAAHRPDVAIGFMHSAYVPLALASVGTRIPVVASEHTAREHYRSRPLQALLMQVTAPLLSAVTVTSERVREGFAPALARRMTPIPNPVAPAAARIDRDGPDKILLCVGGLRPEKDHRTLIAAFASIASAHLDWSLRIVGDGPLRRDLEHQARAAGIGSRVVFAGAVADIASEYSAADLFVMPSFYESFGLATAEALAAGLPAVGFADCPGTNELIRDGVNGILVTGSDRAAALADGLNRLMGSTEARRAMAQKAPQSVAAFGIDAVASRWEALLAEVAAQR